VPYPLRVRRRDADLARRARRRPDETDLSTRNQAFTVLEGVLRAFRRRLEVQDALRFADELPVPVRALFVHDWDLSLPRLPFGTALELAQEVRSLRPGHNSAGPTAVPDVARALRRFVRADRFDAVLATLPEGAADVWRG
jgi:uncharacterized protein (DUF2267 family)